MDVSIKNYPSFYHKIKTSTEDFIAGHFLSSGLAYCRHLSTVRTHLSALVNTTIVDPDVPCHAEGGLTVEVWEHFLKDSSVRF